MAPITILNQNNVPQGPFTRQEVAQKIAAGEFTLNSLAHMEGLAQWTPLRDVLARVDVALAPPALVSPLSVPPTQTPGYSYAVTMQPPSHLVYAGFWLRFVAYFIDGLILVLILSVPAIILISMLVELNGGHSDSGFKPEAIGAIVADLFFYLVGPFAAWLYFAIMESGSKQATYGKRIMGLCVTDMAGQRIGFGRATARFFGKIVSAIPFDLGFVMAGFTDRKQALHDMMAGTLVVRS
jgi:uncharacterized RDD family membrane protein YckC